MKKHKQLLKSGELDNHQLPEGIKEKIEVFDQMERVIEKLSGQKKNQKQKELKKLDQEIYDDLMEEYSSELESSDLPGSKEEAMQEIADTLASIFDEDEPDEKSTPPFKKGDTVEIIGGKPKYIGELAKVEEYHPSGANSKAPESVTLSSTKFPEGKALYQINHVQNSKEEAQTEKLQGDEHILDQLFTIGRTKNLSRTMLKELGIKTELGRGVIQVGKYILTKSSAFLFVYRLERESKNQVA